MFIEISQLQKEDKTKETHKFIVTLVHILVFIFYSPSQDY